jgi:hypothetical protein
MENIMSLSQLRTSLKNAFLTLIGEKKEGKQTLINQDYFGIHG